MERHTVDYIVLSMERQENNVWLEPLSERPTSIPLVLAVICSTYELVTRLARLELPTLIWADNWQKAKKMRFFRFASLLFLWMIVKITEQLCSAQPQAEHKNVSQIKFFHLPRSLAWNWIVYQSRNKGFNRTFLIRPGYRPRVFRSW